MCIACMYSRRFHEAQAAPPPITNGRVAVLLIGDTGLPRCTMAGRSEQIAAIGWQKDLVFAMLRAKGFGVDVFLATNDCGSGEMVAIVLCLSDNSLHHPQML